MPKLYYPTPDELQGAQPLNELIWFEQNQPLLVSLANTNEGRDLLRIDSWQQMPYPIVEIRKNFTKYYLGQEGEKFRYLYDFRVGAKWGNVIRVRWGHVRVALGRMALQELMAWPSLGGRQRTAAARFGTSTFYPDADVESTTVDGWVMWLSTQQAAPDGFSVIRIKASGTFATGDPVDDAVYGQCMVGSGAQALFQAISRGITLFNTVALDDAAVISSASINLWQNYSNDAYYNQDIGVVEMSALASNTAIVAGDYSSFVNSTTAGSYLVRLASDIDQGSLSSSYNQWAFNATGLTKVNKSGITSVGVTMDADIENTGDEISQGINHSAHWTFRAADYNETNDYDPKLLVVILDFTPKSIMF